MATMTFPVAAGDDGSVFASSTTWPPSAPTAYPYGLSTRRENASGTYYVYVGLVRFDTSGLPAGAVVTDAALSLVPLGVSSATTLAVEWYPAANWPIDSADWSEASPASPDATAPSTALSLGVRTSLPLANAASGVNPSGYTGIRLHIVGDKPTDTASHIIQFYYSGNGATTAPQLVVTYELSGANNPVSGGGVLNASGTGQPGQENRISAGPAGLRLNSDGQPEQMNQVAGSGALALAMTGQPRQSNHIGAAASLQAIGEGQPIQTEPPQPARPAIGGGRLPAGLPLSLGTAATANRGASVSGAGGGGLAGDGQPRQAHRIGDSAGLTLGASGQPATRNQISGAGGLSLATSGQPRQINRISTEGRAALGASGQPGQANPIAGRAELVIDGEGRLSLRYRVAGSGGLGLAGDGQPVSRELFRVAGDGGLALSGDGQPGQTQRIGGDGALILDGDGAPVMRARVPITGNGGLRLDGAGQIKTWLGARVSGAGNLSIDGAGQPVMTFAIRGAGMLDLAGLASVTMGNGIRGQGRARLSGRDSYSGPGTGLHTSHPAPAPGALGGIPDAVLWTLREGDAFRVVIPYGGGSGRTGLARVMSRTINERGVLSLSLQLVADDAMPPVSAEAVGVGPRIRPDERGNLARRMADSERRIHQLQTAEKLRR